MRFSHQLLILAFLATLFRPSPGSELSTKPNNIIGDVKELLIREGHKLSEHKSNQTQSPLIPSNDIVGQIISLLSCGPCPLSPNSYLQYSLDYDTKNLRLLQACDRNFKTTQKHESFQVQCINRKWVFNDIGCKRITCPRLTAPAGGHVSSNDNTYNTTVYFWCSSGFSLNGTDKLFCEESGLWNLTPPTCSVSHCRPLSSPRHGSVSSQDKTATNQTVEFSCNSEYSIIGNAVLRCQGDGRWNTTAPVCKKMCTVLNSTSQSQGVRSIPGLKQLPAGSLLHQGQRVVFSCKPGYTSPLSGTSTCIGGTWRPPIRCRKACVGVEIANGRYTLSRHASTIEYSCLPGYQRVGQQKLSCTPDLTWDSEPPICTKLCTLLKQRDVLSFRQKETYEIIPFGTQIINGTQVYPICGPSTPHNTTTVIECVNGELSQYPCRDSRASVQSGLLNILDNGEWHTICKDDNDVCAAFGYKSSRNEYCYNCNPFDLDTYLKTTRIILKGENMYRRLCLGCK